MNDKSKKIQGEGDYKSAKKYNDKSKQFVEKGAVEKNKKKHVNLSSREKEEAADAREKAKSRARE